MHLLFKIEFEEHESIYIYIFWGYKDENGNNSTKKRTIKVEYHFYVIILRIYNINNINSKLTPEVG